MLMCDSGWMVENKLKIADDGSLVYTSISVAYPGIIAVSWSDIFHKVDYRNESPHPPFSQIYRFWINDNNYDFHRKGKPALYEYINGILYQMSWIENAKLIEQKTILDGIDIKNISVTKLMFCAAPFFKKYPHLRNWTKWTTKERILFKMECL